MRFLLHLLSVSAVASTLVAGSPVASPETAASSYESTVENLEAAISQWKLDNNITTIGALEARQATDRSAYMCNREYKLPHSKHVERQLTMDQILESRDVLALEIHA